MKDESGLNSRALALIAFLLHLNACLIESKKPPSPGGEVSISKSTSAPEVVLKAPENHHFNLKAPQELRQSQRPIALKISPSQILVAETSIDSKTPIEGTLMICDEKETYCVAKKVNFIPSELKAESQ